MLEPQNVFITNEIVINVNKKFEGKMSNSVLAPSTIIKFKV